MLPGFVSHLDPPREKAASARQVQRLASFRRLIRFDNRGVFDLKAVPGTWPLFTAN